MIDVLLRAASTKTSRPMAGTHSSNVLMCLPEACRRDDEMQILEAPDELGKGDQRNREDQLPV